MLHPRIVLPRFPSGYVDKPKALLPWSHVEQRLRIAGNYWLCSVRPNGHPHVIPIWAVWVDDKIYFDGSRETRHARNISQNPHVNLHLESGDEVVIMEGTVEVLQKPMPELARKLVEAYAGKYAAVGYAPTADQWDNGGLFEITPHQVMAWTRFTEDPTKFIFE